MSSADAAPPVPVALAYRPVSWGLRAVGAGLLFLGLELLYVGLPLGAIRTVSRFGLSLTEPTTVIAVFGSLCAVLGAASFLVRPTRAYGPLLLAASAAGLAYLWALLPYAHFALSVGGGGATLGFEGLLELLMVLPAFGLVRGALVLAQDVRDFPARRAYEYPAL